MKKGHAYDGAEWRVVFKSGDAMPWWLQYPTIGDRKGYYVVYATAKEAWEQAKRLARKYRGRAVLHRKDGSIGNTVSYEFRRRAA